MFKAWKFLIISSFTSAYADETTFYHNNENPVTEVIQIFEYFSIFSGSKPNKPKCKIAGIGILKGGPNGTLWNGKRKPKK